MAGSLTPAPARLFVLAVAISAAAIFAGCSDDGRIVEHVASTATPGLNEDLLLSQADEFAREFSPEPTPTPTAVPSPTPTPTAEPVPPPTPVPEPEAQVLTEDPAVPGPEFGQALDHASDPTDGTSPNLVGHTPDGWQGAIVITSATGRRGSGPIDVYGEHYVSLAVANVGGVGIGRDFFVDLYFDDYLVQRFPVRGSLDAGRFVSWTDYSHVGDLVRLSPGRHTLRVVIDSTELVTESDEMDNAYEVEIELVGEERDATQARQSGRGVNLTLYSPLEWGVPLVASAHGSTLRIDRGPYEPIHAAPKVLSGPLSVQADTFVAYGITNSGNLSHPGGVLVDLYIDDTLILRDRWVHMIARQRVYRSPWGGLNNVVSLEPGRHVLKVVVDPNDLVAETDESDNVFVRELTWSDGPVGPDDSAAGEPPEAEVPEVLLLPNLVPGWLWEWDGPIVVNSAAGTITDGPLSIDEPVFVDLVVYNESVRPTDQDFVVDLFLDGVRVNIVDLPGPTPAKSFRIVSDWDGLSRVVRMTPGPHVLKMVIDPDDRVREADETDNVFEKRFVWSTGPVAGPTRTVYSEDELREAFSGLPDLLYSGDPVLTDEGEGDVERVLRVADAGFFLITGSSFRDERINARVLSRPEYVAWIDDTYRELFAVDDGSNYEALARAREWDKSISLAKKQRRFGVIDIAVDGDHPFGEVLNSLVHELGHALQDRLNPGQTEAGNSLELSAIREAQAQQLERVFWLAVEEFTGERYTRYPDYGGYRTFVDVSISADLSSFTTSEHALGRMVQWTAVLADPNLSGLRQELLNRGELSRSSAFALYLYLVSLDASVAVDYLGGLMPALGPVIPRMAAITKSRLADLSSPLDEGSPYLRHAALLSP